MQEYSFLAVPEISQIEIAAMLQAESTASAMRRILRERAARGWVIERGPLGLADIVSRQGRCPSWRVVAESWLCVRRDISARRKAAFRKGNWPGVFSLYRRTASLYLSTLPVAIAYLICGGGRVVDFERLLR